MEARSAPALGGHPEGFAATARTDTWWSEPVVTGLVLLGFVGYATWAAFQGAYYYSAPYLSPFYSPLLFIDPSAPGSAPLEHAWLGAWPAWWPSILPASPAFLILMFPGLFRFTCYYYRKAYYRAIAGSPPACAVTPAGKSTKYFGETRFLSFQNLHRYALYFALVFIPILAYDAFLAFFKDGRPGIGVGTIVLLTNVVLLSGYTFGCHSFRHLIGGRNDCMSCGRATLQYKMWKRSSALNEKHMLFAWMSLVWVAFTDVYVRLVSMGIIHDLNTWGS